MKLYRTQHHNSDPRAEGLQLKYHWQGTQADAAACRRNLKAAGMKDIETKDIDIPTDKAGLIAWLNSNVVGE